MVFGILKIRIFGRGRLLAVSHERKKIQHSTTPAALFPWPARKKKSKKKKRERENSAQSVCRDQSAVSDDTFAVSKRRKAYPGEYIRLSVSEEEKRLTCSGRRAPRDQAETSEYKCEFSAMLSAEIDMLSR